MTISTCRIALLLSSLLFACATAIAQTSAKPTPLAVEVRFADGITGRGIPELSEKHGAWWERFPRVAGWVPPANSVPVTAVRVQSQRAEEGVRVWVSVILGKVHEDEKQVSAYLLREGDKTTVKELAEFGVVPIEIRILRFIASAATPTDFKSKVASIELVSMIPNSPDSLALPSIQLVLRNVSAKPVHALEVHTVRDGVKRLLYQPQGKEGEALILPGQTFEIKILPETRAVVTPNSYQPQQLPNQTIEVSTSVFTDGSYEGEYDYAMGSIGVKNGRKIQLARIIDLLKRAANDKSNGTSLKDKLNVLNVVADPAAVAELRKQFPQELPVGRTKTLIEIGLVKMRDEVLKDLTEFEIHNRYAGAGAFDSWLTLTTQRYQAWLSRL